MTARSMRGAGSPYRADIDGLRAIAVAAVVGFHAFPSVVPGGFVGVDVFFTISGYLISTIIFKHLQAGTFAFADFYARRIRRIFPALLLVLVTTVAAGWMLLFSEEYRRLGKHVGASAAFLSNFFFWRESGYFDANADFKPLLHLWSLGIEEQFYLVWPLLLVALWRKRVAFGPTLAVICGLSFALSVWSTTHDQVAAFYSPWTRCWELGAGALYAKFALTRNGVPANFKPLQTNAISVAGACLIALAIGVLDRNSEFPGLLALLPVLGTVLLIAAGPRAWINRAVLSQSLLVAAGLISFPIYLWHWPILSFLAIVNGGTVVPLDQRLAAVVGSLGLATLTYLLIEKRVRLRPTRSMTIQLTGAMATLFAAGSFIFLDYGLPQRPINATFHHSSAKSFYLSRQSDDSCKTALGIGLIAEEVCLTNATRPTTLFVGDSHAMALYSAIFERKVNEDAMLIAGHSCDLYPNVSYKPTFKNAWGNNCTAIANEALRVAASIESVTTVVIANKTPDFSAPLPSALFESGRPVNRQIAFRDGNAALVSGLIDRGKRVVFVTGVPVFRYAPVDCERRLSFVQPKSCSMPKSVVLEQRKVYREEVARLQAAYPSLIVLDSLELVCPQDSCRSKQDGRYLYEDDQHLSVEGSEALLHRLSAAVLTR